MKTPYLALLALTGCSFGFRRDETPPPPPPPPPAEAPFITLDVPSWPPLGPDSTLTVHARHPRGLTRASSSFKLEKVFALEGSTEDLDLHGRDLGEGYGRAEVIVESVDRRSSSAFIEGLLVDLTPPQIDAAGPLALGPGAKFRVTASDAWILGRVEIEIYGFTVTSAFERGFPATFGTAWDVAEVEAPIPNNLESGRYEAVVRVRDAAGNAIERRYDLEVDATPPILQILEPAEGSTVADHLALHVAAEQDSWIEVAIEGAPIAELAGPDARADVDLSIFPRGRLELEAIARDAAGNASAPVKLSLRRSR